MEYPSLDVQATGERIRSLRVEKHLRVEDIAIFMGFESPNAVYKWQRGECLPTVDNLYALSRLFNTTIDDILIPTMREEDECLPLRL
ncbi:MAG: helix-turn-helix transcriptional regulator [Lachnospiraceae bacterium]|nr:helix-turn-helix transcriptional regulator [Lachnospiraceae bacterium]